MAIPSKKEIDFDVYQRQDPASTVDWGKAAKDITTTFQGIRDTRQAKKDAIEKSYQDQQKTLQDIGEYDNPTIQQFVMNGGQDAANKEQEFYNLVKRGLAKPADYTMFQHNLKTGFDLVKKNAEQFDNTFKEYTTRVQDGTGAPGEQWIAEQLEGFANMNNMSLQADPETGDMVMLRTDDEGNPIPGESMSVQRMTLLMKQQIDNFDIGKEVLAIKEEMGTKTTTMIRKQYGPNVVITKEMKSRAEEEFFGTKNGNDFLSLKVDQLTSSPYNVQSMIVNGNLTTPNGTKYEVGGEEDYDRWMEENGGDEKNNPYLVMEFGEDNLYKPKFNETQDKAAKEYARAQITGALDYSEEKSVKGLAQKPQPSAASIAKGGKDEKLLSQGKNLMFAVSGDPKEAEAGLRYLVDASNGNVEYINKTKDGFMIKYPGKDEVPVSTQITREATKEDVAAGRAKKIGEEIKEDMSPVEAMRVTWKAAGLQDAEFDAWLAAGGNELLKDRKLTTDAVSVKGPQSSIEYDTQAMVLLDGNEVSAVDFIVDGPLGKSPSTLEFNTNAEFINEYSNLLNQESFFPKGIGAGKITMDGDNMTFTIGGTPYAIGDVFGQNTTETVALLQEAIQEAISNRSKGGNASKY